MAQLSVHLAGRGRRFLAEEINLGRTAPEGRFPLVAKVFPTAAGNTGTASSPSLPHHPR